MYCLLYLVNSKENMTLSNENNILKKNHLQNAGILNVKWNLLIDL